MLTPLKEDNSIDIEGLKKLTEFYIASGANGLFANCLSSEMFQLTNKERIKITKTVIDTAGGRIPVISTGSFGDNTSSTAGFIKKLYDIGTTAVVISTSQPCNELASEDTFKAAMESLLEKTGEIPLGLYECPVPYKRLISPELLKWLARSERFLYHKDTVCDLAKIKEKIEVTKGTMLGIYNAHVPTGLASIKAGARGISPIAANMYPELFSYLLKNLGDESLKNKHQKLNDYLDMMDTIIHHNYPYSAKFFLQKRGFDISTKSRIPRIAITPHDLGKLETVIRVFRELTDELEIELVEMAIS
jgi:4-hydroxy-tetrahydrodipicolinate synthase